MSDAFLAGSAAGKRCSGTIHGGVEEGRSTEDSFCLPLLHEHVYRFRKMQQHPMYFLSANFLGAYYSAKNKNTSQIVQRCILH